MKIDSVLQEQRILESLSTLSYRTDDLANYLHEITLNVSRLLQERHALSRWIRAGFGK